MKASPLNRRNSSSSIPSKPSGRQFVNALGKPSGAGPEQVSGGATLLLWIIRRNFARARILKLSPEIRTPVHVSQYKW